MAKKTEDNGPIYGWALRIDGMKHAYTKGKIYQLIRNQDLQGYNVTDNDNHTRFIHEDRLIDNGCWTPVPTHVERLTEFDGGLTVNKIYAIHHDIQASKFYIETDIASHYTFSTASFVALAPNWKISAPAQPTYDRTAFVRTRKNNGSQRLTQGDQYTMCSDGNGAYYCVDDNDKRYETTTSFLENPAYWKLATQNIQGTYERIAKHHDLTVGKTYKVGATCQLVDDNGNNWQSTKRALANPDKWRKVDPAEDLSGTYIRAAEANRSLTKGKHYTVVDDGYNNDNYILTDDDGQDFTTSAKYLSDPKVWKKVLHPSIKHRVGTARYLGTSATHRLISGKVYDLYEREPRQDSIPNYVIDKDGNQYYMRTSNQDWKLSFIDDKGIKRTYDTKVGTTQWMKDSATNLTQGIICGLYKSSTDNDFYIIDNNGNKLGGSRREFSHDAYWKTTWLEPTSNTTNPNPNPTKKEVPMLTIKKTTLINDNDVDNVSASHLMDLIKQESKLRDDIEDLDFNVRGKSAYVAKQAQKHNRNIQKLVKLLDAK